MLGIEAFYDSLSIGLSQSDFKTCLRFLFTVHSIIMYFLLYPKKNSFFRLCVK